VGGVFRRCQVHTLEYRPSLDFFLPNLRLNLEPGIDGLRLNHGPLLAPIRAPLHPWLKQSRRAGDHGGHGVPLAHLFVADGQLPKRPSPREESSRQSRLNILEPIKVAGNLTVLVRLEPLLLREHLVPLLHQNLIHFKAPQQLRAPVPHFLRGQLAGVSGGSQLLP
jgi:hypothetical protein